MKKAVIIILALSSGMYFPSRATTIDTGSPYITTGTLLSLCYSENIPESTAEKDQAICLGYVQAVKDFKIYQRRYKYRQSCDSSVYEEISNQLFDDLINNRIIPNANSKSFEFINSIFDERCKISGKNK